MNLTDLTKGDEVVVDGVEGDSLTMEVQDIETQDLGLTEVVVVALTAGCDIYALKAAEHSDTCELEHAESDESWEVELADLTVKD